MAMRLVSQGILRYWVELQGGRHDLKELILAGLMVADALEEEGKIEEATALRTGQFQVWEWRISGDIFVRPFSMEGRVAGARCRFAVFICAEHLRRLIAPE